MNSLLTYYQIHRPLFFGIFEKKYQIAVESKLKKNPTTYIIGDVVIDPKSVRHFYPLLEPFYVCY